MPRYDRFCPTCKHRWETVEPMDGPVRVMCPKCRGRKARRVPAAPALHTDTNLSERIKRSAAMAGERVQTRTDLRRFERSGMGFVNDRDLDHYRRKRGKAPREALDAAVKRANSPIEITSSKRRRRQSA